MSCGSVSRVYLDPTTLTQACPGTTAACPCRNVGTFRHTVCATACPIQIPACSPVIGATGILQRVMSVFTGATFGFAPTRAELDAADCACNCIEVPVNLYDATLLGSVYLTGITLPAGITVQLSFCSSNSRTSCLIVDPDSPNSASELGDGVSLRVTLSADAWDPSGTAATPASAGSFYFR